MTCTRIPGIFYDRFYMQPKPHCKWLQVCFDSPLQAWGSRGSIPDQSSAAGRCRSDSGAGLLQCRFLLSSHLGSQREFHPLPSTQLRRQGTSLVLTTSVGTEFVTAELAAGAGVRGQRPRYQTK